MPYPVALRRLSLIVLTNNTGLFTVLSNRALRSGKIEPTTTSRGDIGKVQPEIASAFSLEGRVVVITGAGSGLGQEAARIFALAGACLALADISESGLAATSCIVDQTGGSASTHRIDLTQLNEVQALADTVKARHGRVDVWINSAGVARLHSILETDPAEAERIIAVNLMGCYWGCMAAGRVMRDGGGGAIVNVSSAGGSKPLPGMAVYGMTKAGVNSLTWTCATEFGPFGIRVNAIGPGWVETPMGSSVYRDSSGKADMALRDQVIAEMRSQSPLGTIGTPADIAFALLYLSSDAGRFVTGQVLRVNGGESM